MTKEFNKTAAASASPVASGSKTVGRKPKSLSSTVKEKPTRIGIKRQNSTLVSKAASKFSTPPKQEHLITEESVEYGRRQSKRVCVTRKSFLFNMY